jgi:hypothetical protein
MTRMLTYGGPVFHGVTPAQAAVDRDVLRTLFWLGLFFCVVVAIAYALTLTPGTAIPRDGSTLVVGRDFLNFWMYGRAAALPDPGHWYDVVSYQRALGALLGQDYPGQNWSYPPSVMPLAAPFGLLPYLAALAAWTILGLGVFAATLRARIADTTTFVALLASPAAIFCIISGQSSLLTAAALIGIFVLIDRRPLVAGVLIGCLTLKPQLGLLFPIMLIASGRWRVFCSAAVTALAIVALTTALVGTQPWIDFIEKGLPIQNLVLADPHGIATPFYPTVFMNLRGIGVPYAVAMTLQIGVALAAAAAVWWGFRMRRDADPRLLAALFLAASVAATPYLLSYDTLALAVMTVMLLAAGLLDGPGRLLVRFVYWLPLLQVGLGSAHIPGPGLIAPAMTFYLVRRLQTSPDGRRPETA